MTDFDVIVLGLGGMGSATAFELARRGQRVLGLEQYSLGHDRGSSHGHTRIIRKAYFEHVDYVPLLERAYERWRELEAISGRQLMTLNGVLNIGLPTSEIIAGVKQAAALHQLPVEHLNAAEIRNRWPQFQLDEQMVAVFESAAGFLFAEQCVLAHAAAAQAFGADLREQQQVLRWKALRNHVEVETSAEVFRAQRLVITAGPWAGNVLSDLALPLTIMRQTPMWFGTHNNGLEDVSFAPARFPCYIVSSAIGDFYGFPEIDQRGVKVAKHYGGVEQSSPTGLNREVHEQDERPLRQFLQRHLPGVRGPRNDASVCMYTLTPDRHFVIDLHPAHPQVCIAAGFSGHGFKFAGVVGEILADLSERGRTALPIAMFRANRFLAGQAEQPAEETDWKKRN